jgi:hypothetical protein
MNLLLVSPLTATVLQGHITYALQFAEEGFFFFLSFVLAAM